MNKNASEILNNPEWTWNDDGIFAHPNIPRKKLTAAINSYAPEASYDDVLILIDDTVFGGSKEGLLITSSSIYCKQKFEKPKSVCFDGISKLKAGSSSRVLIDEECFFKADIVEHFAMLRFTLRLSSVLGLSPEQQKPKISTKEETSINSENKKESNNMSVLKESPENETMFGIERATQDTSIFYTQRKEFQVFLKDLGADVNMIKLCMGLFDISLSMSSGLKKTEYNSNELSYLFYDDDSIYESCIYTYFLAFVLIAENTGVKEAQQITTPFYLFGLFYFEFGKKGDDNSFKSAIDPMKHYMESDFCANLKRTSQLYIDAFKKNDNSYQTARDWLHRNFQIQLSNKYKDDFYNYMNKYNLYDSMKNYVNHKGLENEKLVEQLLIRYFKGQL